MDRERELSILNSWWHRVQAELQSAVVAVIGPSGMGKSALIDEFLLERISQGSIVLAARADEFASTPMDCLRWAVESLNLPPGRDSLVQAREACRQALRTSNGHSSVTSISASIAEMLAIWGGGRPVIISLDDAQAADLATLEVLGEIVATSRLPVLLIVAFQPTQQMSQLAVTAGLHGLEEQGLGQRIELGPLTANGVRELMENAHEGAIDPLQHERLMEVSLGNPLLVHLAVKASALGLIEPVGESDPGPGAAAAWPSEIRAELLRRFVSVGSPEAEVAAALAVLGHTPADPELLARILAADPQEVAAAIESLVVMGLIECRDGAWEFVYSLIREAFESLLVMDRRRELHRSAAEVLMTRSDGSELNEVAGHLVAAGALRSAEECDLVYRAAAHRCAAMPGLAAEWFGHVQACAHISESMRERATLGQLSALLLSGAVGAGWSLCREVLAHQEPTQRSPKLVEVAAGLAYASANFAALRHLIEETPEPLLTPSARATAVVADVVAGHSDGAGAVPALVDELLADPDSSPIALTLASWAATMVGVTRPMMRLQERLRAAVDEAGSAERLFAMSAHDHLGPHLPSGIDIGTGDLLSGEASVRMNVGGWRGVLDQFRRYLRGDWDEVAAQGPMYVSLLRASGNALAASVPAACTAAVLLERGDLTGAREMSQRATWPIDTFHGPLLATVISRLDHAAGDIDGALRRVEHAYERGRNTGVIILHTMVGDQWAMLLESTGQQRDAQIVAQRALEWVRPKRIDLLDAFGLLAVARTTDDLAAARAAHAAAIAAGVPLLQARCDVELARLGDSAAARLTRAHQVLSRLGAQAERVRCEQVMRHHDVPTPRGRGGVDTLTPVESAVVREVVRGHTNRQIATNLRYSPKTIEMHLSRIYARTGRNGRVELVRAVTGGEISLVDS